MRRSNSASHSQALLILKKSMVDLRWLCRLLLPGDREIQELTFHIFAVIVTKYGPTILLENFSLCAKLGFPQFPDFGGISQNVIRKRSSKRKPALYGADSTSYAMVDFVESRSRSGSERHSVPSFVRDGLNSQKRF